MLNYYHRVRVPSEKVESPLKRLTPEQLKAFTKFKSLVFSSPFFQEYPSCVRSHVTDLTLYRYLSCSKWKSKSALKHLKICLDWRAQYRPKNIDLEKLKEYLIKNHLEDLEIIYSYGYTKNHHPIVYANPYEFFKLSDAPGDLDRKFEVLVFVLEDLIDHHLPENVTNYYFVCDAGKVKLKYAKKIHLYGNKYKHFSDYYSERLLKGYIVNVPKVIIGLWKIVCLFMYKRTVKKYMLCTDCSCLLKDDVFDKKMLLKKYGGDNQFNYNILHHIDYILDERKKKMQTKIL